MITVNDRKEFLEAVDDLLPPRPMCVEIGILNGDFSEMILDTLYPALLMLIDPFEVGGESYSSGLTTAYSGEDNHDKVEERFKGRLNVVIGRNYSYNVVKRMEDKSISFCYHDASHLYEDLKRDLNEWLPKMKDDGIISGHDYLEFEDFGVIQAVNEFMEEHGFEMVVFNINGGDWALKKK